MRVPAAAVGSPAKGDTLYSVGTYALLGARDPVNSVQALPLTVDSTPTFDAVFGAATARVPAKPVKVPPVVAAPSVPSAPKPASGPLAATGLPVGAAALGLLLLLGTAAVRRRLS